MRGLWIVMSLIILFQGSSNIVEPAMDDLTILLNATKEEGFLLDEWEVVFLENLESTSFEDVKLSLQANHFVTEELKDGIKKYKFQPENKHNKLTYQIVLLESDKFYNENQMQIVFTGTSWNEEILEEYRYLTNKLQQSYKLRLKENFTCIKVNDSDIMNDGFSINNLLKKIQLVHKQEQQDNIAASSYMKNIYGYSPILSNAIEMETLNEKMNIQLTIRKMTNNKKQIIIGTPVILNEY